MTLAKYASYAPKNLNLFGIHQNTFEMYLQIKKHYSEL